MNEEQNQQQCCGGENSCCSHCCGWIKKHKWFRIVLVICFLLAFATLFTGNCREGRYSKDQQDNNFQVSAQGKVYAKPDVAIFSAGVTTEPQRTVSQAVKLNTDKMNAVIDAAKKAGVKDEDIKTTNYSINPQYSWDLGKQTLIGYGVNNQVAIKIRDLEKVDDTIQSVTEAGANTVGGVNFTIDDQEVVKAEARKEAIALAKAKAKEIAKEAGMKIGEIINVTESSNGYVPPIMYARSDMMAKSMTESAPAPQIEAGQQEITVDVTLTYKIKE